MRKCQGCDLNCEMNRVAGVPCAACQLQVKTLCWTIITVLALYGACFIGAAIRYLGK